MRGGYFLATDFINFATSWVEGTGLSLAKKLAKLHTTTAPVPKDFSSPRFGFRVRTFCGSTEQRNDWSSSWANFFANQRLKPILLTCQTRNPTDAELARLISRTAFEVVPRLIGDSHLNGGRGVSPVVVHGDLWSGNKGRGVIRGGGQEEVVFDPSSCYAHSEYELGIMKMFGGFDDAFFEEYHKLKPQDEPVEEYEDRIKLYKL
jgi:protein-ribulosamine 3-kinase